MQCVDCFWLLVWEKLTVKICETISKMQTITWYLVMLGIIIYILDMIEILGLCLVNKSLLFGSSRWNDMISRICFKIIQQVKSGWNEIGCKLMTIVVEWQVCGGHCTIILFTCYVEKLPWWKGFKRRTYKEDLSIDLYIDMCIYMYVYRYIYTYAYIYV